MADDSQQFFGGNAITYQAVFDLAGGFDTGIFLVVMILIGAYLLIHNVLQISLSKGYPAIWTFKSFGNNRSTASQGGLPADMENDNDRGVLIGSVTGAYLW